MDKILEFVKTVDWAQMGSYVIMIVTAMITIRTWFNKNIVNIKDLRDSGNELSNEMKYNQAHIRSYSNLINELSVFKRTVGEQGKSIKKLTDTVDRLTAVIDKLENKLEEKGED